MLHAKTSWNILTIIVTLLVLTLGQFTPNLLQAIRIELVIISILVIGLPHGAIDHIIAGAIGRQKSRKITSHFWMKFYATYLGAIILVGAIWFIWPLGALLFFFFLSAYHWGQADMVALKQKAQLAPQILYWARGILIVAALLFSNPAAIEGIVYRLIDYQLTDYAVFNTYHLHLLTFVFLAYLFITFRSVAEKTVALVLRLLLDSLLVVSLFVLTDPLVGFAVYFSLWHSLGHVEEMISFMLEKGEKLQWSSFYVHSVPFTLLSIAGLGILYLIYNIWELDFHWLPMVFVIISALTLPHMFVVERMYELKRPSSS